MRNLLQRIFSFLLRGAVGLTLLLMTLTLTLALARIPLDWRNNGTTLVPLGVGFGGGLIFFSLISRFLLLYVFGHELTHFIVAKMFLRKTGRFRLGTASGSVAVERPNIWISLAPYFVPVYTFIWIGIYGVVDFFWQTSPSWVLPLFAAGVGVSYAFHVRLTLYALGRRQSDLQRYGRMVSFAFIAFCNVFLLYVALLGATGKWGDGAEAIRGAALDEWRVATKVAHAVYCRLGLVPRPGSKGM